MARRFPAAVVSHFSLLWSESIVYQNWRQLFRRNRRRAKFRRSWSRQRCRWRAPAMWWSASIA